MEGRVIAIRLARALKMTSAARGVWLAVLTSMLGSSPGCDSPHQLVVATTSVASESSFHYMARITGVLAGHVNGDGDRLLLVCK